MFCSKGRITLQRYRKTITPLRERILLVELLHAGYAHAHSTNVLVFVLVIEACVTGPLYST